MTNTNEAGQEARDEALDGLPENQRKETQEILDEIGKENPPKPEEKPVEKKPEAEKKPDEKPIEDSKRKGLVPNWILEMKKDEWEKEKSTLLKQIKDLSNQPKPEAGKEAKEEEKNAKIKSIADKFGIEEKDVNEFVDIVKELAGKPSPDLLKDVEDIRELKRQKEIEVEEAAFNADFDKIIAPLVKTEYSDKIPPEILSDIKEKLKEKAYDPKYVEVPLSTLYKGEDGFRGLYESEKKGAEGGRTGFTPISAGKSFEDITDEDLQKMSPEEFEKYSDRMAQEEKKGRG